MAPAIYTAPRNLPSKRRTVLCFSPRSRSNTRSGGDSFVIAPFLHLFWALPFWSGSAKLRRRRGGEEEAQAISSHRSAPKKKVRQ